MTKQEIVQILAVLKANYSGALKDMSKQEAEGKVNLWLMMFADVEKEEMSLAIQKIIATSKYFPTVAEVREALSDIQKGHMIDSGQAWGEVIAAIQNYGPYKAQEAFDNMSEVTRITVQRMGWRNLCLSENTELDRAHFLKLYLVEAQRQKESNLLPLGLLQKIEQKQLTYQQQQQQLQQQQKEQKLLEQEQKQKEIVETFLLDKPKTSGFTSIKEMFKIKKKEYFGK